MTITNAMGDLIHDAPCQKSNTKGQLYGPVPPINDGDTCRDERKQTPGCEDPK